MKTQISAIGKKLKTGAPEVPYPQYGKGFTLVELLIVMLIVSLGAGLVALQVDDNRPYRLRLAVNEFVSGVTLLSEEAVLANQQWGIDLFRKMGRDGVENSGYRWLLQAEDKWIESSPPDMANNRMFPAQVEATLEVEGVSMDIGGRQEQDDATGDSPVQPDIRIFSSGEITSFNLTLSDLETPGRYIEVSADQLARMSVSR